MDIALLETIRPDTRNDIDSGITRRRAGSRDVKNWVTTITTKDATICGSLRFVIDPPGQGR